MLVDFPGSNSDFMAPPFSDLASNTPTWLTERRRRQAGSPNQRRRGSGLAESHSGLRCSSFISD